LDQQAVVNEGTGQGGERVIEREEDIEFKSLRQAEAMALRRIAENTEGNFDQREPEPEPEPDEDEEESVQERGAKSMLGEMATSTLEVKRSETEKSGHRRDAAEARLERLAQLKGEDDDNDSEE
jgi:hypothetical protein